MRLLAVVMLSSSFLSFGYFGRAYELSRPPKVISGVVKTNWGYRRTDSEVRSDSGEVISFDAVGLAALDGQFARISYLPLSHQVLSIEGRRSDGVFYDTGYHDEATFLTKWMLATALLLLLGSASVAAEGTEALLHSTRGTIGDTVHTIAGDDDIPGMRWRFIGDRLVSREEFLEHEKKNGRDGI